MTKLEQAYKEFEKEYSYDYQAQPDNGTRSVIFSYWKEREDGSMMFRKFEAPTLEKAFNYALMVVGLFPTDIHNGLNKGDIKPYDTEKWYEQTKPTHYFSIGEQKWKNLAEELEKERIIEQRRRFNWN